MTEAIPWRTNDELAADDQAHQEVSYAEQLDMEIAREARKIRVREAAVAQVRAEKVESTNFDDYYLDRAALSTLTAPDPLIHRVMPRHSYGILRGRDHSFKSFVAIDWALCLATGKPWQGHDVEQVPVLYVAGEGAHGLAKRVDAWEYSWGRLIPAGMFTVRRTAVNMHQPGPAFDQLLTHVTAGGYGLVIVDTLRRVSGAADGNSSEMGLVIDNLDRIKQATADGTVLAVAHTDKGDHDTRGYSGIEDDADFVWSAKREEMLLTLELTKMKDGPDGRRLILEAQHSDGGSLVLSGFDGPNASAATNESQVKVLTTLAEMSIDGMAPTALLKASGLAESTYYRAIKALHETGQITNVGSPSRKLWAIPAIPDDSHDLPPNETASDLHVSHHSHQLPLTPATTPTTPTTLRSGSEREVRESDEPEDSR